MPRRSILFAARIAGLFVLLTMLVALVSPAAATDETPPPPSTEEQAETPDPAEWPGERLMDVLPLATEETGPSPEPVQWVSAAEAIDAPLPAYDEEFLPPESVEWLGAWDVTDSDELTGGGGTWLGSNLIRNGDAEQPWNGTELPGWTQLHGTNWVMSDAYSPAWLTLTDLGPVDRGARYFMATPVECWGSACLTISARQTVNLTAVGSIIDTNQVTFALSGYFGGVIQNDTARLRMEYLDQNGSVIPNQQPVTIGNVTADNRLNKRGMLYRSASGKLPRGTRSVRLTLELVVGQPPFSYYRPTGLADSLSLVLTGPRVYLPLTVSSGSQQAVAQPSKPAAPTNLVSALDGVKGLKLTWQDNATNETGYRLERKKNSESAYSVLAYLDAGKTTYTDSGLTPGIQAAYRLLAYNAAGDSPAATHTATMPAAASIPNKPASCWISNLSSTSVDFFWTDSSDNEQYFPLWIAQAGVNGGQWRQLANMAPNATNVTIIDLLPGTYTALSISALNQQGESLDCVVNFTPPAQTGGIKVKNNASYPIAYLTINGVQQYPTSPMGLLSGTYLQLNLPPGAYQVEARDSARIFL